MLVKESLPLRESFEQCDTHDSSVGLQPLPQRKPFQRYRRHADPKFSEFQEFINVCEKVEKSGEPNFIGCRSPLDTHLQLDEWERLLENYEDKEVVELLKFGFPISFEGDLDLCEDVVIQNHKGANEQQEFVSCYLEKEVAAGHMMGPFKSNPFSKGAKVNALNTVPKKDSDEPRVISDLSYPKGRAVNDGIDKTKYLGKDIKLQLATVDDFARMIWKEGPGCLMFRKDLKGAYRQYRIDPGDVRKLAYVWNDELYFDLAVPMGLCSGAYICQRVTDAINFIYTNMGYGAVTYLDDFASAKRPIIAWKAYDGLGALFQILGSIEAIPKSIPPYWIMLFLGILFNSVSMTMEIDPQRLKELRKSLRMWLEKENASRKEVESLIGLLSFVSKCVRPARVFMARAFDYLAQIPDSGMWPVTDEFKLDVKWWYEFVERYNGVSLIPLPHWSQVNQIIETDACLTGCGGVNYVSGECFHVEFPVEILELHLDINQLELLTVMVAIKLWKDQLKGNRIRVQCDNTTAVAAMNKARMRTTFAQRCMREIAFWTAMSDFEVWTVHIEGVRNVVADALSRWHTNEQYKCSVEVLMRDKGLTVVEVPVELFDFTGEWI